MKYIYTFLLILFSYSQGVCDIKRLAPQIDPLPDAEIEPLFTLLNQGSKVAPAKLHQALLGDQTALRAFAARKLGTMGDDSSIPFLIDALSDMSMHDGALYSKPGMETTRFWANESLKQLTNNDFGFVWNAPEKKRQKAINRWQQWYSQTIGATNVATPDANSGRR